MRPAAPLILATMLCAAYPVLAQPVRTIERSGPAGAEVRIFTYTPHRADCSPVNDVRIVLRSPPAHGSLATRPDTVVAGASRFGAADCAGRPIAGLGVYYMPQPGFRGTDRFDYDAVFGNGTEHATATVTVR